jgi:hypothetical protein
LNNPNGLVPAAIDIHFAAGSGQRSAQADPNEGIAFAGSSDVLEIT